MKISMKLVSQYMVIFFNFSPTSNHIHPLQVGNCDSNARLVVNEDDIGKLRLERLKHLFRHHHEHSQCHVFIITTWLPMQIYDPHTLFIARNIMKVGPVYYYNVT